jgi:uncharacterized membrane protein YeaQ/YmgE (transglycosylase-associated protein family)
MRTIIPKIPLILAVAFGAIFGHVIGNWWQVDYIKLPILFLLSAFGATIIIVLLHLVQRVRSK